MGDEGGNDGEEEAEEVEEADEAEERVEVEVEVVGDVEDIFAKASNRDCAPLPSNPIHVNIPDQF